MRSVAVLSRTRFCSHPNLLAGFLFSTAFITLRLHAAMLHRLRDFSGQISKEIDRFCADLRFFFYQRKSFAILTTRRSRTEPVAKLLSP